MAKRDGRKRTTLRTRPAKPADTLPHEQVWSVTPRGGGGPERHAFLLVLSGPQLGRIFPLPSERVLVLGRREDADLVIHDEGVSRRHATVEVRGEGAVLRDLGSANGTWIDGKRTAEAYLVDGSRVAIGGQTVLKFVWADELEARYQMKLAEGALQDPLTGLHNRRHLGDRLGSEVAVAERHGRPLSLLLVDVDRFKAVNDEHGHLAGDEALKMTAFVLRGAVRKEDVLARYGGDEFVVVARETALGGAEALGERIRRAVERSRCAWQGIDHEVSIGVTVSVGVAQLAPGRAERELVEAADRALYLAKKGGRNRVVAVALEEGPPRRPA